MAVREQPRVIAAHRQSTETTLSDVVRFLDETLGRSLTAYIANADPKSISRWMKDESVVRSTETESRLRVAYNIFLLLQETDVPHTVRAWFIGLNPQLGDISPAEAIREGRLRKAMTAAKSFALGG